MKEFKLDNEPKINSGFKTPVNYFDDFYENVVLKIPEKETKVITIFEKRKTWIYVAAAILVTALFIPVLYQNNNQFSELDDTTIENYLAENAGISETELFDLLQEDDLDKINFNHQIDDQTIEDILIINSNFEGYLVD